MPRGRRARPDELKALAGNPGKRRLIFGNQQRCAPDNQRADFVVPEFLTHPRERQIFEYAVQDYFQKRIVRAEDLNAYGRWAVYARMWEETKQELDCADTYFTSTSKHGEQLRRHPLFKDLLDLEKVMQGLEDRCGLNPAARQRIVQGLSAISMIGPTGGESDPKTESKPTATDDADPLGYLQRAAKPH